jgi:RNA polymerase sigma-70 factor (ECF subfamily)
MRLAEFEQVVEAQKNRVYTLAYYILGKPEDAEEILQEVLLRLWQNRRKVDAGRLGPWLARVTRNACYDRLRRRTSAGRDRIRAVESEQLERAPGRDPDPEQRAVSAELKVRITDELQQLAEPFRSVLILREIQELKYHEISEVLELPLNTVRVYLHRGRRRLRERLRRVETDERA